MASCIPHLYVANISDTIQWYEKLGFECTGTHKEDGCEMDWALLDKDGARFMLYPEGPNNADRKRNAGLYFTFEDIEGMEERVQAHAEIIEIKAETEYGMQEIVFKDLNGFQITFGCRVPGKNPIKGGQQPEIHDNRYVLAVQSLQKSSAFYQELLGFKCLWSDKFWCFLIRDSIKIMLGECPDEKAASEIGDHSYFAYWEVTQIDKLFQEFVSKNVKILGAPEDKPWNQREFSICTIDGHRITVGEEISRK